MSESQKLIGKIIVISEVQTFQSGFQKREFVVETPGEYPQKLKFETTKEGIMRLDSFNVGDELTVYYNLRGNEHNGKYYVSLQAWKLEREAQAASPAASPHQQAKSNAYAPPPVADDDDDDIPF